MVSKSDRAESNAVEGRECAGDSSLHGTPHLTVASPWARYWAKSFDMTLGWVAIWLLLAYPTDVLAVVAPRVFDVILVELPNFWLTFFFTPVVFAIEVIFYDAMGNTPGKRLLGLKVLSLDGRRLDLARMLRRNFGVYVLGFGMMLPVVPLFTLARAHYRAQDGEPLPWDVATESRCYSVRNTTLRTWIGAAITVSLAIAIFGLGAGGE